MLKKPFTNKCENEDCEGTLTFEGLTFVPTSAVFDENGIRIERRVWKPSSNKVSGSPHPISPTVCPSQSILLSGAPLGACAESKIGLARKEGGHAFKDQFSAFLPDDLEITEFWVCPECGCQVTQDQERGILEVYDPMMLDLSEIDLQCIDDGIRRIQHTKSLAEARRFRNAVKGNIDMLKERLDVYDHMVEEQIAKREKEHDPYPNNKLKKICNLIDLERFLWRTAIDELYGSEMWDPDYDIFNCPLTYNRVEIGAIWIKRDRGGYQALVEWLPLGFHLLYTVWIGPDGTPVISKPKFINPDHPEIDYDEWKDVKPCGYSPQQRTKNIIQKDDFFEELREKNIPKEVEYVDDEDYEAYEKYLISLIDYSIPIGGYVEYPQT